MRRRRRGAYRKEIIGVSLVGVSASLAACNLIAGINDGVLVDAGADSGGGMKRDGGPGNDGGRRDGGDATARDGSSEAATGDGAKGGGDAEAGVQQYNCSVMGGSHTVTLGALTGQLNGPPQLFLANTGPSNATQFRLVVPDSTMNGGSVYEVYTFSQGGQASNTPIPSSNVLTVVRYATGIGALIIEQDPNNLMANVLAVTTLEDSPVAPATVAAWSTPVIVGDDSVLVDCANYNYRGALFVNNAAQQDYSVVSSCAGDAGVLVKALHYVEGKASPILWPAPPSGFDAGVPNAPHLAGMTVANGNLYVMTTPGSGSAQVPHAGSGPSIYANPVTADAAAPKPSTLTPNQPTDFLVGATLAATVTNEVGVMVLEADLGSVTGNAVIYAGSVPGSTLRTLTTATALTATPVPSLAELPYINNGNAHWQSFASPPSDNLIAVGAEYPNSNGLNFMWWNGQGQLVAKQVGTAAFYYSDPDGGGGPVIQGGDVVLSGPPLPASPSFVVAYVKDTGTASAPTQGAFADTIACTGTP